MVTLPQLTTLLLFRTDVYSALSGLNVCKAADPEGIPGHMLRACPGQLAQVCPVTDLQPRQLSPHT